MTKQTKYTPEGYDEEPRTESGEVVFDFTRPVETMDALTREAYYRLRFVVIRRGGTVDELPDGKTLTLSEVETLLGGDLGAPAGPKPCC